MKTIEIIFNNNKNNNIHNDILKLFISSGKSFTIIVSSKIIYINTNWNFDCVSLRIFTNLIICTEFYQHGFFMPWIY